MADVSVEVTPEPEPPAEPTPSNVTVVTDAGGDDGDTSTLVAMATTLGRIEARLTTLEEKQQATARVAVEATEQAAIATDIATGASAEVAEATDQAIDAATEAVSTSSNEDMAPQREHPFFRKYRVKGE